MKMEQIKNVIQRLCPEMLSNENFMRHIENKYCEGKNVDVKTLSDKEYSSWIKIHEVLHTATIGQLIKHLKENFKSEDKLCYMDCVEGYKNDCTYVTKNQLGERFFYYAGKLPENMIEFVNKNDVVVC